MAPKRNYRKEATALAEQLRGALKAEVRRRDFRQVDLEEELGRSHGYFSHLFGGRLALTIEGVLEVLLAIGADPAEFFATALGADGVFRKGGPSPEDVEATVLRALRRYGYGPGDETAGKKRKPGRP
jgi:hypothetical protein